MWNGTMFVDLDWPLNASSLLSASAELLVLICYACAGWGVGRLVIILVLFGTMLQLVCVLSPVLF